MVNFKNWWFAYCYIAGKQVLLKFMKENEIHCSLYAKVRTKIMNEQRKIQMKARKVLYDKWNC